jgi:hypothetical protein
VIAPIVISSLEKVHRIPLQWCKIAHTSAFSQACPASNEVPRRGIRRVFAFLSKLCGFAPWREKISTPNRAWESVVDDFFRKMHCGAGWSHRGQELRAEETFVSRLTVKLGFGYFSASATHRCARSRRSGDTLAQPDEVSKY